MEVQMYICAMCPFTTPHKILFNNHYVRTHQFDNRFRVNCSAPNCGATYSKWSSYKKHVARKHPEGDGNGDGQILENDNGVEENDNGVEDVQMDAANEGERNEILDRWNSAQLQALKFILYIRDSCKTSHSAVAKVMEGTTLLMQSYFLLVMDEIRDQADPDTMTIGVEGLAAEIQRRLPITSLFSAVDSRHKLDQALTGNFGMLQPQPVILGHDRVWRGQPTPRLVRVHHKGYIIPFLENVRRLLNNDQVRFCIDHPRVNDTVMKCVLDGSYYKSHDFFSRNNCSLAIILYYDEVEIVNPLGSKTHKLGAFYWSLANVYPEFRSSYNAINLLGIAKYCHLQRFGITKFLEAFVQDMQTLQTEGITVTVNGVDKTYKGSLLMVTADTPAAALLGGFKRSVSASKPCRRCMADQDSMKNLFLEVEFTLRSLDEHLIQLAQISDRTLAAQARNFWCQMYGVNEASPLLQIPHFDVTKCFPQDIMHILSEGCLEVTVREFLKWCVDNDALNLNDLNTRMDLFRYGHMSKDKPSSILAAHLNNGLRQSAAQMFCLANVLPFLLSDLLPEPPLPDTELHERLKCLVSLLQITNICFAFKIRNEVVELLRSLIETFLSNFKRLYPDALVPKFHFLIHLPSQILEFGPLRQQWCMRFEAVHSWFKTVSRIIRCYKNMPFSLSYRYETYRCLQLNPLPDLATKQFLYLGHFIGEGPLTPLRNVQEYEVLLPLLRDADQNNLELMRSPKVTVHGTTFVEGSITLIGCEETELPEFGVICGIFVRGTNILFIVKPYKTDRYEDTLNAYCLVECPTRSKIGVALEDLLHPFPLSLFYTKDEKYVVLLNHDRTEFLDL